MPDEAVNPFAFVVETLRSMRDDAARDADERATLAALCALFSGTPNLNVNDERHFYAYLAEVWRLRGEAITPWREARTSCMITSGELRKISLLMDAHV